MKILITGDLSPINNTERLCKEKRFDEIIGDFREKTGDVDYFVTNLESPLTDNDSGIPKGGPLLKADPVCIELLTALGVNIATLANNHILDYGSDGLADTMKLCTKNNIRLCGAGINKDDARKPLIIESKTGKVAILNIAENEFSIAGDETPGANGLDLINNYYDILNVKEKADFVLVILHGGNEGYQLPRPDLQRTFRFLADAGADAVVGHHPHCPGGIETYKGKLLVYSLGNFIFDWPGEEDENWFIGFALKLNIDQNNIVEYEIIPYQQFKEGNGIKLLKGDDKSEFMDMIESLSSVIKDETLLLEKWQNYAKQRKKELIPFLFNFSRVKRKLYKKNIFSIKPDPAIARRLLNYIRCESHHELLKQILKQEE